MSGRRIGPISYSNETARWADRSRAGLQVDVQGSYNAQNQFVANTIKFNGNGLHYAIEIQAGITPVEQQEQLQSALDSFPGIRVSRLRGSDLATPNRCESPAPFKSLPRTQTGKPQQRATAGDVQACKICQSLLLQSHNFWSFSSTSENHNHGCEIPEGAATSLPGNTRT